MNHVTLKPLVVDGTPLQVAKPQGGYLAAAGEPVVLTGYWRRRISDGDVVQVQPVASTLPPGKAKSGQVE